MTKDEIENTVLLEQKLARDFGEGPSLAHVRIVGDFVTIELHNERRRRRLSQHAKEFIRKGSAVLAEGESFVEPEPKD